jgi:hypothetical protein
MVQGKTKLYLLLSRQSYNKELTYMDEDLESNT